MARIIFPEDFESQYQLGQKILAKHTADGTGSKLTPYLTEQDINLTNLVANGSDAKTFEQNRADLSKTKEDYREQRDLAFVPALAVIKRCVQFLKVLYKPQYHKLGAWSVTVNGTARIVYPVAFVDQVTFIQNFIAKHASFPSGTSPLQPFIDENSINIPGVSTLVGNAVTNNTSFVEAGNDAEAATESRNNLWLPRMKEIEGIANYLIKLMPDSPKGLGKWGYTVDDSPRAPKLRKSKLKLSETKTVNGVVIGSTFSNIGETTLQVYQGKTASGTSVTVLPGEKLGIAKGMSTITVVNTNSLEGGLFTTLVSNL